MARAILSILGLYNHDRNLFQGHLVLPNGLSTDIQINAILRKCAELPLMWPNGDLMESLIGYWSREHLETWTRMWTVAQAEYNPLENYDRMEEWDDEGSNTKTGTGQQSCTGNYTETNKVAGYNSETLVNKDQRTGSNSGSQTASASENGTATNHREGRAHGNIGVTTSQQMLQAELDVAPRLDIYDWIAEEFKHEFCLLVY